MYGNFFYFLLSLIGFLPLKTLYIVVGKPLFWILKGIGYRKKIILQNLNIIFPHKNKKELTFIHQQYYRRLADFITEIIKMTGFSYQNLMSHITIIDEENLKKKLKENKKNIFLTAHFGNWEWMVGIPQRLGLEGYAVYQPLSNKIWDHIIYKLRKKFHVQPVASHQLLRMILQSKNSKNPFVYCVLIDQSPHQEHAYYTDFFNLKVPFYHQMADLVEKFDLHPFYLQYYPNEKKGHYTIEFVPMSFQKEQKYNLIEKYKDFLMKDIQKKPYFWLLSHRRFKHQKK